MNNITKFIENMKDQYVGMDNRDVLEAVQTDSQHEFIMNTQGVSEEEASKIIDDAEEYLLQIVDCQY
ncbi:MAG: hypothetical protein MIO93_01220 [ANME-2 cluster archaeon]|nr:hypothetical protein [ANME-2 cluster archaeon]